MTVDPTADENVEPIEAPAAVPTAAMIEVAAPVASARKTATITVPRTASIIAAAVAAVVLLGGGFAAGAATAGSETAPTAVAAPTVTVAAEPVAEPVPVVAPTPTTAPAPAGAGMGTPVNVSTATLPVNSSEIVDPIDVVSGDPLVPVAGGELVLFRTSYMNTQNAVDLSCSGGDLYIQVFDEKNREMAPIFETYRIPGNQGCNDHLLQGTTVDWNWAVQGLVGAVPTRMEVTDSLTFGKPTVIRLQ